MGCLFRDKERYKKGMKKEKWFEKASWRIFWAVKGRKIKVSKEWEKMALYRGNSGDLQLNKN